MRPEIWRRFVIGMSIGEDEMEEVGIRSTSTSMAESKRKKFVVKNECTGHPTLHQFRTTKLFVRCCMLYVTMDAPTTNHVHIPSRISDMLPNDRKPRFEHPRRSRIRRLKTKQTRHAAPSTQEYESSIPRIADYVETLLSRRAEDGSRRARNALRQWRR